MKPRLEPALPTKEDIDILCYTWPGRDWRRDRLYPIGHSISADRRDADLMLQAKRFPLANAVGRSAPILLYNGPTLVLVRMGSWNASWWPQALDGSGCDITYFA